MTRFSTAMPLVLATVAAILATSVEPAAAGAVESPKLAAFELVEKLPPAEGGSAEGAEVALSTFAEDGRSLHRLLAGRFEAKGFQPDFFGGIAFSPDGAEVAFAAEATAEEKGSRAIYLIGSDGSGLRRLPGTAGAAEPHFSPDGTILAFSRTRLRLPKIDPTKLPPIRGKGYASTTTWLLDLRSGKARRLTPWKNGLSAEPGSFSPDGETLAITRVKEGRGPAILLRSLEGGPTRTLAELGEEPDFSPDGSKVVFVGYQHPVHVKAEEGHSYDIGDLYSIGVDGKGLRRVTENRAIETSPAWDPSGNRIGYVEAKPDRSWLPGVSNLFPVGNRIREVNADGTCAKTIRSALTTALYGVAWRPGGTASSPIDC